MTSEQAGLGKRAVLGKLARLAERRAELVAQTAQQRAELTGAVEPWHAALGMADHGLSALRFIARHKILAAGAVALALALRPNRGVRVLLAGLRIWRTALAVKRGLGG